MFQLLCYLETNLLILALRKFIRSVQIPLVLFQDFVVKTFIHSNDDLRRRKGCELFYELFYLTLAFRSEDIILKIDIVDSRIIQCSLPRSMRVVFRSVVCMFTPNLNFHYQFVVSNHPDDFVWKANHLT